MVICHKKDYGFHLTFSGIVTVEEMTEWVEDIKIAAAKINGGFYVFVDMREMEIFPVESKVLLKEGQTHCKNHGMIRSVVILNDDITAMQLRLVAKNTGIYQWERYIFSSDNPNWEKIGMDWLLHAIDPDKKQVPTN